MHSRNRQIAQLWCLIEFLQAVCVKRALVELASNPMQEFWCYLQGLTTDKASIEFCKIFASTKDHTHWTNSFDKSTHREIRARLYASLEISPNDWAKERESILDYRNMLAAHHDLNARVKNYPDFSVAVSVARFM